MKVAVSFLSIKNNLNEELKKLARTSADYIHVDVMDGNFVKNITRDIGEMQRELSGVDKPLDVHLMVNNVKKYIDEYSILRPSYITFHYEAIDNHLEAIKYIKSKGIKAGISIKPDTKIDEIRGLLDDVDLVLVMSVEPGKGGQEFLDSAISKVYDLYDYRQTYNYQYLIEVDGGINDTNMSKIEKADMLVVGSFVTSGDYETQINKLKPKLENQILEAVLVNDKYQQYILTEFIYSIINSNGNHVPKIEVFQLMFEPQKFAGSMFSNYEIKEVNNMCRAIRLLYKDKIENNFAITGQKIIELNDILSEEMIILEQNNKYFSLANEKDDKEICANIAKIKNNGNVYDYVARILIEFIISRPFKTCMEKTAYLIANVMLIKYGKAPIIFTKEVQEKVIQLSKTKNTLELELYITELSKKEKEIFMEYL